VVRRSFPRQIAQCFAGSIVFAVVSDGKGSAPLIVMETLTQPQPRTLANHAPRDYARTPVNVYWEITRACALACRHCRAEASPEPDPAQLSFTEGLELMKQIKEFGSPLPQLILTGGDPLERPDLFPLIDEARRMGIGCSITPAATDALTREVLVELKAHGIEGLGLSLDAATANLHDSIRGVPGTFARTIQAMRWAQELEIPLQVNTLVSEETAPQLPAVYELLKSFGIARWSLFFLISVGRGKVLQPLSAEEGEKLMGWIYRTSRIAPFTVATTEAPAYRRVALEEMRSEGMTAEQIKRSPSFRSFGIRDGHGIVFVSHIGEITPAGFLPLTVGNVREDRLADIYRNAPAFRVLHDPTQLEGRCGRCQFHMLCGGSRARAFESTGNPYASDPFCTHTV
jgi:radical SAM protein